MLFAPSGKGRKRRKKGEFRPISRKGGQTPLKPPFVTPPFAAAQESAILLHRSFFNVAVLQFFACCSAAFGKNDVRTAEKRMLQCNFCSSQRVRGGEPEGVRKHLLSKKGFLCSKKVFRRKKASKKPLETF